MRNVELLPCGPIADAKQLLISGGKFLLGPTEIPQMQTLKVPEVRAKRRGKQPSTLLSLNPQDIFALSRRFTDAEIATKNRASRGTVASLRKSHDVKVSARERNMRKTFGDNFRQTLESLLKEKSMKQIGALYGKSTATIYNWRTALEREKSMKIVENNTSSESFIDAVRRLAKTERSKSVIAKELNTSWYFVSQCMNTHAIELKHPHVGRTELPLEKDKIEALAKETTPTKTAIELGVSLSTLRNHAKRKGVEFLIRSRPGSLQNPQHAKSV